MAILSYRNAIESATVTVKTGTAERLDELKQIQVPIPFASITPSGGVIELRASFASATIGCIGIIGHSLPQGAEIEFRDSSNTALATLTVSRTQSIVTIDPIDLSEIRFYISNAGGAGVGVALLWAGEVIEAIGEESGSHGGIDYGYKSKVGSTVWSNPRTVARTIPVTLRGLTDDQAWGELEDAFTYLGTTRPAVYIPRTDSQAQIDRRAVYGTFSERGSIIPDKPFYAAEFNLEEMA